MYLNKVQIIGNLTRDPELKALPSGSTVVNFSVATNRTWKDANGQKQEAVEYHNIVFFGKSAEIIAQYVFKGHQIYIEGRLSTRSWEKDGVKQYRTEIVGEQFQFGSKPKDERPGGVYRKPETAAKPKGNSFEDYEKKEIDTIEYPTDDINPEDIPF